jgi:hypothetical protein
MSSEPPPVFSRSGFGLPSSPSFTARPSMRGLPNSFCSAFASV